jgi:hypothetical protein
MIKLTVICQTQGFDNVLIYTVQVSDPDNRAEVQGAINRELGIEEGEANDELDLLFAFQGELAPRVDWRD